jgi:signal transduction histidine kinase
MQSPSAMVAIDAPAGVLGAPPRSAPAAQVARNGPSLAAQFLIANLIVLLASMGLIGFWVGTQIEAGVLDHAASTAAFYVDSVISPHLQVMATKSELDADDIASIDWLMDATLRGRNVVEVKIWSTDGTILYSRNKALIGRHYGVDDDLREALRGEVNASVSDLQDPENEFERQEYSRLLSVYAPVRHDSDGRIIGVTEFYQPSAELDADINAARTHSWLLVGAVAAAAYLMLAGIVKRGSDTIIRQGGLLRRQFGELSLLHERLRQAASRATTLNEQALRRISADLHDGPAQTLSLALLRLDSVRNQAAGGGNGALASDFAVVHGAVRDAMAELRTISANLRTPELEPLSVAEVAERAVDAHRRRTGAQVDFDTREVPEHAPLPIKIAVLRTLQEALSNASRHGRAVLPIGVELRRAGEHLHLTVIDHGRGFDVRETHHSGGLGLVGMRERAELLGGTFDIHSHPGDGTVVHACWLIRQQQEEQ